MAAKALNPNQHIPLHNIWPNNCCLCDKEKRIAELEAEVRKLKAFANKHNYKINVNPIRY
jgi:hypothetical protein